MKTLLIVLAIVLNACGTRKSTSSVAAGEDVEYLNDRINQLEGELKTKNNEPKPKITEDEIWAEEDKNASRFGGKPNNYSYTIQKTYRDENGIPTRYTENKSRSDYQTPMGTQTQGYFHWSIQKFSKKHNLWLTVKSESSFGSLDISLEEAEADYEATIIKT